MTIYAKQIQFNPGIKFKTFFQIKRKAKLKSANENKFFQEA